jgi:hypothetical protein
MHFSDWCSILASVLRRRLFWETCSFLFWRLEVGMIKISDESKLTVDEPQSLTQLLISTMKDSLM